MKKISYIIGLALMLTAYSQNACAQYYFYNDDYYDAPILFEAGASIGFMNCLTDIGGKKGIGKRFIKDLNLGKTHIAGGIYLNAMYQNTVGIRVEGTFGSISANDNVLAGVTDIAQTRFNRNLNFRSKISEVSVMLEIHPLFIFKPWEKNDGDPPRISPYILAGIGFFSFNPQAELNNTFVDLQPLSTEGQGFKEYPDRKVYKLQQTNIPLGLGVRYELSSILNVRGEFVYRKLNTDYLDDVSTNYIDPTVYANYFTGTKLTQALLLNDRQISKVAGPDQKRGSPKEKDAYFSFNLKIGLLIGRQKIK